MANGVVQYQKTALTCNCKCLKTGPKNEQVKSHLITKTNQQNDTVPNQCKIYSKKNLYLAS